MLNTHAQRTQIMEYPFYIYTDAYGHEWLASYEDPDMFEYIEPIEAAEAC